MVSNLFKYKKHSVSMKLYILLILVADFITSKLNENRKNITNIWKVFYVFNFWNSIFLHKPEDLFNINYKSYNNHELNSIINTLFFLPLLYYNNLTFRRTLLVPETYINYSLSEKPGTYSQSKFVFFRKRIVYVRSRY